MSGTARNGEAAFTRISVEIPAQHAPTAELMIRGIRRTRNMSVSPVLLPNTEDMPLLFTMIEDERERLIPAIQRPHIRDFAVYVGASPQGLGERLISGIWRMPRYSNEFREESNWRAVEPLLLTDRIGGVVALKAREVSGIYNLLAYGHASVANIGEATVGFLGQLSTAVQASLLSAS